ncbi:hypothetical protein M0R72_05720 [Candidatus Pacearchaeota archaeon]|jgi:hypothetical protein|nr:hypothetical protein [Candidatus Pacearchaeota archaeon]
MRTNNVYVVLLIALLADPTVATMTITGITNGKGTVTEDFATSEQSLHVNQALNDSNWTYSYNNTSLRIGNDTWEVYENGTIERVGN